jgi:hypothetical protein
MAGNFSGRTGATDFGGDYLAFKRNQRTTKARLNAAELAASTWKRERRADWSINHKNAKPSVCIVIKY